MSALAEQFVDWAWSLTPADLPPEVSRAARRHLLDGWGCALAAARLGTARPALTVAGQATAPPEAAVPGLAARLPVGSAAFAIGALVHALDFDDTHPVALVHPTAVVLPVLSAVGQLTGASPAELETAAVCGYEFVIRLGAAVPHGFHARGFHATSVCGVFAATLVAARLLGLTRSQAVSALGIAGSTAAGSMEFLAAGTETKALHPALAGQAAVTAARLAAAGATGPASILEGRYGLFAAYLQDAPPQTLAGDLGERWEVTRIDLKPYPCCHLSHATLDALGDAGYRADDLESCVIDLPEASVPIVAEPRPSKVAPRTPYEAKFSLPWTAAALLIDGKVTVDTFTDIARPQVVALADRIAVRPVQSDYPPATALGKVALRTRSGEIVDAVGTRAGHADQDAVAVQKFVANAGDGERSLALARSVLEDGWRNP
jgi:2-methylcitrate dehydratase PrpD